MLWFVSLVFAFSQMIPCNSAEMESLMFGIRRFSSRDTGRRFSGVSRRSSVETVQTRGCTDVWSEARVFNSELSAEGTVTSQLNRSQPLNAGNSPTPILTSSTPLGSTWKCHFWRHFLLQTVPVRLLPETRRAEKWDNVKSISSLWAPEPHSNTDLHPGNTGLLFSGSPRPRYKRSCATSRQLTVYITVLMRRAGSVCPRYCLKSGLFHPSLLITLEMITAWDGLKLLLLLLL